MNVSSGDSSLILQQITFFVIFDWSLYSRTKIFKKNTTKKHFFINLTDHFDDNLLIEKF